MLYSMKHGVIGSGPCGALAALLLLEAGFDVDLIDVDNNQTADNPNLEKELKLVDGDSSPYDINQILKIEVEGKPATFYRSKVEAGFSKVWGATWNSPWVSQDDSWVKNYSKVDHVVSKNLYGSVKNLGQSIALDCNCDCLSFLSASDSGLEGILQVSDLAVQNLECGCVASGKSFCIHGSVWNSSYLINECRKFPSFTFRKGVDVTDLKFQEVGVVINSSGDLLQYDMITLAAGPLGTAEVLLNSLDEIKSISMNETRMGFLPFLRYKLNTGHSGAFAFSQFKFDIQSGDEGLAHVQLYAHSEQYSERIEGKAPKVLTPFVRLALKFLTPHMGIALIYLNSAYSESLKISKLGIERKLLVELFKPTRKNPGFGKKIWSHFREIGLLPLLPALSWAKPGESYHLGAVKGLLDDYGFLRKDSRLSVAGSFALPVILPGPITHAAMAQTARLVERIVHQNLERT